MRRLLVWTDHSLNAQTALLKDQLTTTHANNAHSDKFKTQLTWEDVSTEHAMVQDKSNNQLTQRPVVNARLADGQHSCQTSPRLNALLDHLLFATAERRTLLTDTLVNHAQLEPFKAWLTKNNVLDQHALVNTKSNSQLIPITAVDVKIADGHNSNQIDRRLNVSQDHWLIATALAEEVD